MKRKLNNHPVLISILFIAILINSGCKLKSQSTEPVVTPYNPTPLTETPSEYIYGDYTTGIFKLPADINISDSAGRVAGIEGTLKIKSITGIKGLKYLGLYNAFAFTEKDTHQVWLIYYTTKWNIVKLGGIPNAAGDTDGSGYTWFNAPLDVEIYSGNFFVSDSENKKIRKITFSPSYAVSTYATLSYKPVNLVTEDGSFFYLTTREGVLLKAGSGTANETLIASALGSTLYGITMDTATSTLYFVNGRSVYSISKNAVGGTPTLIKEITASDAAYFKDIEFFNNKLYIADTKTSCIYIMDTAGTSLTVFAGAEGTSGDNIGDKTATARFQSPVGISVDNVSKTMYISDNVANNVKTIASMDSTPTSVVKIPVESTNPKYLYDPLGLSSGEDIYIASSNDYVVKRLTDTSLKGNFDRTPYGIWDVKVVQRYNSSTLKYEDAHIFLIEVDKITGKGFVTTCTVPDYSCRQLKEIPGLAAFGTSLTLNDTASKLWLTSRELNAGKIYQMNIRYVNNVVETDGTSTDMPSIFMDKTGYWALGITFAKNTTSGAEYLLTTSVTSPSNVYFANNAKVSRFKIKEAERAVEPANAEYDFWTMPGGETLTTFYPRYITTLGQYVYFVENKTGRVYRLDALGAAGQTARVANIKYTNPSAETGFFKAYGIALGYASDPADGAYKPVLFFSSDANDLVLRYFLDSTTVE